MRQDTDRTLVAVFDDREAAEEAVESLHAAGFAHDRLGFAIRGADDVAGGMITDAQGTKDAKGAVAGAITGGMVGGVLAAAVSLLLPGIGPVVAGGILASFFGGAVAGTAVGGILGAMTGLGVSEEEARFYEKQFHEGRAIVAVKPGARLADAAEILVRFGGRNVHAEAHSPVRTDGTFSTP
jgi:hypothetical protein